MTGTLRPPMGYGRAARFMYIATAGQTSFSGPDSSSPSVTMAYVPGFVEVAVNGLWLPPTDYTATNGSAIVFGSALAAGDIVYAWSLSTMSIADAVAWTAPQSLSDANKLQARQNMGVMSGRNLLLNGTFAIDQRNAGAGATVADNAYWADRWRYIGEVAGGSTCYSRDPNLFGYELAGAVANTSTTDKFGIFQVIENENCRHLRSTTVVFSATLLVNVTALGNIKMAILEFTGTADAVSGDPISSWGADGVTPTLAANWAFITTPTNLNVPTSSLATYSVTGTVGASANNIAVMVWNDDKVHGAGDYFRVGRCQLEEGSVATPYERRDYSDEMSMCQRYYLKIIGVVGGPLYLLGNASAASQYVSGHYLWPSKMRIAPTVAYVGAFTAVNCNTPTFQASEDGMIHYVVSIAAGNVQYYPATTPVGITVNAEL